MTVSVVPISLMTSVDNASVVRANGNKAASLVRKEGRPQGFGSDFGTVRFTVKLIFG